MNVAELLEKQAKLRPEKIAIIETGNSGENYISYGELQNAVLKVSGFLTKQAFKKGEAILIFQPMSIILYVYLLACFRLGIIAMFIDPGMGRRYIEQCCSIFPPKGFLATPKAHLYRIISKPIRKIPFKFTTGCWVPGAIRAFTIPENDINESSIEGGDEIALLTFTSGSTGKPKAAARSHNFLLAQNRVLSRNLNLVENQRDFTSFPIFVLANLAAGLTTIIPSGNLRKPAAIDGDELLKQIDSYNPDRLSIPPSMLKRLLESCENQGRKIDSGISIYTGGSPVFPNLLKKIDRVACKSDIVVVYGSTEAEPIAELRYSQIREQDFVAMSRGKGLLAGNVINDVQLKIISSEDGVPLGNLTQDKFLQLTLPSATAGEIVVTGNHVLKGYLQGIGDKETKFSVEGNIWHRTGDAGYLDDENRLWLLGRHKKIINDEFGVAYPFSIECAAMQYAGVQYAAFVCWENQRVLVLEVTKEFKEEALTLFKLETNISKIVTIKSLPLDKRHNGKVDYPALMKWLNKQ